jgi:hypothetical protein
MINRTTKYGIKKAALFGAGIVLSTFALVGTPLYLSFRSEEYSSKNSIIVRQDSVQGEYGRMVYRPRNDDEIIVLHGERRFCDFDGDGILDSVSVPITGRVYGIIWNPFTTESRRELEERRKRVAEYYQAAYSELYSHMREIIPEGGFNLTHDKRHNIWNLEDITKKESKLNERLGELQKARELLENAPNFSY